MQGSPFALNYLHYGNGMQALSSVMSNLGEDKYYSKDFIDLAIARLPRIDERTRSCAKDILYHFPEENISVNRFRADLEESMRWRKTFSSFACRGFSFVLAELPEAFPFISSEIVIKIFLLCDPTLYYPFRVRKQLSAFPCRHVNGAIAWVLALERMIGGRKWWIIVNIQSDAASSEICAFRQIFRGWQRVLIGLVFGVAGSRGVNKVAIPSITNVGRDWVSDNPADGTSSKYLYMREIYDSTAKFMDMKQARTQESVDIRVMRHANKNMCDIFYIGDLGMRPESRVDIGYLAKVVRGSKKREVISGVGRRKGVTVNTPPAPTNHIKAISPP